MDAEWRNAFAELGVSVAVEDEAAEEGVAVWAENWLSVTAFLDCGTQWRAVAGLGGVVWLGLDYSGVDVVLRRREAGAAVFADVQVMERAALAAFDEAGE